MSEEKDASFLMDGRKSYRVRVINKYNSCPAMYLAIRAVSKEAAENLAIQELQNYFIAEANELVHYRGRE